MFCDFLTQLVLIGCLLLILAFSVPAEHARQVELAYHRGMQP